MAYKQFEVSEDALRQARRAGLFGNLENRLKKMARFSAPFTDPEGKGRVNRRFESFVLKIENGVVTDVRRFDPELHKIQDASIAERRERRLKTLKVLKKHGFG
jgi:hypothetical protein